MDELDKIEKSKAFTLYQSTKEEQYETKVNVIHNILSDSLPELPGVIYLFVFYDDLVPTATVNYSSTHVETVGYTQKYHMYTTNIVKNKS